MDQAVDPRTWPDERPAGAVVRAPEDPEVARLKTRVEELEEHLYEAEQAVVEQEQEIQDLEARLRDADEVLDKKGVKARIDRSVARERDRVRKEYEARLRDQQKEHQAQLAEVEVLRHGDRMEWDADHRAALVAKDREIEALEAELREGAERILGLQDRIAALEGALERADQKQQAIIAQAAQDVAEAELHGRIRTRSQTLRERAGLPRSLRDEERRAAEDALWDQTL